MTWFQKLTGITEDSPTQVREQLTLDGTTLHSPTTGATYECGRLETPSLAELRRRNKSVPAIPGPTTIREAIADVQKLHRDPASAGSLFQVASQFNLLEMVGSDRTPELGVGIYENDHTQGPACAIAAGAGTIYRNYFAEVNGRIGQSAANQIDCLADLGAALGNDHDRLWTMRNGYALPSEPGLAEIAARLEAAGESELDDLRSRLCIGIQWQTQVTLGGATHRVSQAYCSAMPVAYKRHPSELWAPFARLVLEAAYEATLAAAIHNAQMHDARTVYLTLLGGGAFGNDPRWILDAMIRALTIHRDAGLDVVVVSRSRPSPLVSQLVAGLGW